MHYRSVLTMPEAARFFSEFYKLESARLTNVESGPDMAFVDIVVVLKPCKFGEALLKSSFQDGLLKGWADRFKEL